MKLKNIEGFFLNTLLRVSLLSVVLIFVVDLILYPSDRLSLSIDAVILTAILIGFWMRNRYPLITILTITLTALAAMIYQCFAVPLNTTTSLFIILIVGFVFSVLLKGRLMWAMHALTLGLITIVFIVNGLFPPIDATIKGAEIITIAFTYIVLYMLLTYCTYMLKSAYDKMHASLQEANMESNEKAKEIAAQNEELIQMQDNLASLNANLEGLVRERTAKIQKQNEILMRYSYTNAHDLRGPVARLIGLANINGIDKNMNSEFIIEKMREQAIEVDEVVRKINVELDSVNLHIP